MAAQTAHQPVSGRIKAYLLGWGILAACGLAYLGSLAWQPELLFATPGPAQVAEPDPGLRAATRALAEIGTVRRTIGEMQKDLGHVRDSLEQREARERELHARVSQVEERLANPPVASLEPEAPSRHKVVEKGKADRKTSEYRSPRIISVPPTAEAAPTPPAAKREAIETGSIDAPAAPIVFGEPVVTPANRRPYAVQLAAGPSLDAIKLSWIVLLERHGAALGNLQPHVVPPKADGTGRYRLMAGPLPSKADADKVCEQLGTGRKGCFATQLLGEPL